MTSMPSVLVETGFITNPEEERYLNSKEGQEYIASAIFRASRDYINDVDKKSQISTSVETESLITADSVITESPSPDDELTFMIQIISFQGHKRSY
jgi:N-acetylmuramoyl-L-alanine amidase